MILFPSLGYVYGDYITDSKNDLKDDCLRVLGLMYLDLRDRLLDDFQRNYLHTHFGYNCMGIDYSEYEYLELMDDVDHWTWEVTDDGTIKVNYNSERASR